MAIKRTILITCLVVPFLLSNGGCSTGRQGAMSGAAIGALSGLAIGSLSGNAGEGAAIGAIVGGVGGAVIGDQNRRRDEASHATASDAAAPASAPVPAPGAPPAPVMLSSDSDRQRMALAKLARSWDVSGWELIDGQRQLISGTAVGAVENNYFIRMEMKISADGRPGLESTGNLIFGAEPGVGLTMTSRFSTSPSSMNYTGTVSADGRTLTLTSAAPSGSSAQRRIVIQFLTNNDFVADVTAGEKSEAQASLRFSGAS